METKFVNPLCDPDWDRMVLSHANYSFFHSAAWAKVLSKTYGHELVYLRCSAGSELVALVPIVDVRSPWTGRRGVCLPFTDFCGPLMFGEAGSVFVMDQLSELAGERKWKYFEVRGGSTFTAPARAAETYYGHTLDLRSGPEDLLTRFKSSAGRALRKAERSGLNIQLDRNREAILEFYRLHVRTRRRHGLPPQPVSFFLNIHEEVIKPGLGFVVLANAGSRLAAAAVFFHFGTKAVYKFGASDERLQELRGNNMVMWEGIRFLARSGVETLHFGRTSLENQGLRRFKLNWGTKEERIEYFKFDTLRGASVKTTETASRCHHAVFGRMPLGLNQLAGTIIYPHLD